MRITVSSSGNLHSGFIIRKWPTDRRDQLLPQRCQRLCRALGQPLFDPPFRNQRARLIEVLPITERFRLMMLFSAWLADFPRQFVAACPADDKPLIEVVRMMLFRPEWQTLLPDP